LLGASVVARDVFPSRACSCTPCSSTTILPSLAPAPAITTPCFVEEQSSTASEFSANWNFGVYGSECWTLDGAIAARCLTPGDTLSHAPARGAWTGAGYAPTRVMHLIGDSHAIHLVAGLGAATRGHLSLAYAATLEGAGFNPTWPDLGSSYNCQVDPTWTCGYFRRRHLRYGGPAWVAAVRAALETNVQAGDVVTIVNSWLRMPTIEAVDAYMTFLGEVHTTVASRGATLLLIGETPRLLANGRDCVQPASYAACATPRTQAFRLGWSVHPANHPSNLYSWSLHAAIEQRMQSFTAQRPSTARYVTSAWMFDRLCDAATGMCGPTAPGTTTVVYVDDHHLSTSGSMYLAPFFNCKLRELGLIA